MPAAAKSPVSSKNPAAVARKMYAGPGIVGGNGNGGHAEVVCPLFNADGSACRKKCVGNFAYRSICEHIRRAHPDNWIPKLPASHETFAKMVSQSPRATASTANAQFHLRKPPLHTPHVHQHPALLAAASTVFRKMGKSALKREDDQYMEGLSPPSSANESEPPSLPPISLSTGVSFQSKLPSPPGMSDYDVRDDDEFAHVEDDDVRSSVVSRSTSGGGGAGLHLGLTTKLAQDTEDDSDDAAHRRPSHRPTPLNHHRHQQLLLHHHHHHRQLPSPHNIRPSKSSAGAKRKRVAYAASNPETSSPSAGGGGGGSTDNSSSQSSTASRWDELIEAATNRAVAIDPQPTFRHHSHHHHTPQTPLSPPTTASSSSYTPTLAPPSASATPPSSTTPSEFAALSTPRKLVCATCEGATPMHMAFACTECMSGFCDECAFGAGRRGSCGECRAVGGKFKPLRIIVR